MTTPNSNKSPEEIGYGTSVSYPKKPWAKWYNTYTYLGDKAVLNIWDKNTGEGKRFILDTSDVDKALKIHWYFKLGGKGNKYYAQSTVCIDGRRASKKSKTIFLHKHLFGNHKCDLDHINRDSQDNRRSNLREATKTQNMVNVVLFRANGLPVGAYKHHNKFRSFIVAKGARYNLGMFENAEDASKSWKLKHHEIYGDFSPYKGEVC